MRNGLHQHMHLQPWSPVGGATWGNFWGCGLAGGRALLEMGLRSYSFTPLAVCLLCFVFEVENVSSQLPAPASVPAAVLMVTDSSLRNMTQNKLSPINCFWSWCFLTATEKSIIRGFSQSPDTKAQRAVGMRGGRREDSH